MRLLIPTLCILGACAGDTALVNEAVVDAVVAEVEAALPSLVRDTATLIRPQGKDFFVEAHSDSNGYRRVRVSTSGWFGGSSATAFFDDQERIRRVDTGWFGGDRPDGEEIERLVYAAFAPQP